MKKRLIVFLVVLIAILTVLTSCGKSVIIKVNFMVDGTQYATIDTNGNEAIAIPSNPTKDGYVFQGWYWDENTWLKPFTANSLLDQPISDSISVYAHFLSQEEINSIKTISFNSMGAGDVQNMEIKKGDTITQPTDITKTGYILVGWYLEADFTTKWNFATDKVNDDMTLYAKWVLSSDMGGAELLENGNMTKSGNSLSARLSNDTTKYSFSENLVVSPYANYKVCSDEACKNEIPSGIVNLSVGNNIYYVMVTSGNGSNKKIFTVNLYRRHIYSVTYKYKNGNTDKTAQIEEDSVLTLPESPKKTGYTFETWTGWDYSKPIDGDKTLTASWTANQYTVSFQSNGGTEIAEKVVTFGEDYSFSVPTMENYDFVGWYVGNNAYSDENGASINVWDVPQNTTVQAKWLLHTYTITYNNTFDVENSNPAGYTIETDTITLQPLGEYNGKRFVAWVDADGNAVSEIQKGTSGDITVLASWDYIGYSITFVLGDGHYQENESNRTSYNAEDEFLFVAPVADADGYEFDGWYDDIKAGTKITGITKGTTDDMYLYARYVLSVYTITYKDTYNINNTNKDTYTIETPTFSISPLTGRNGYNFIQWQDEEQTVVSDITLGSMGNITLTAIWEKISYTIRYQNLNDATHENVTAYDVETATVTLTNPSEREGYTFEGWYDNTVNGNKIEKITKGSYGNKTLYARWNAISYDIEYIGVYTATNKNQNTYTIEDSFTLQSLSGRNGYNFLGWEDIDGNAMTAINVGTIGKLSIRATWELQQFTITYRDTKDADNSDNPESYDYETNDFTLNNLAKDGYTFNGWYDAETNGNKITAVAKGSYGNKTLYARWTAISYNITYNDVKTTHTNPLSYTIEDEISFTNPTVANGYTFVEWQNSKHEKVASITQGTTGNQTLTAIWSITSYTITYNNTKDVENTNPTEYTIEDTTFSLLSLAKDGYTFNGWYDAETNGNKITAVAKGSYGNKTLYARWTAKQFTLSKDGAKTINTYTVSFDGNGTAITTPSQTVTSTQGLTYPAIPTRNGYIFAGWYATSAGSGTAFDFSALVKKDITLYAKWIATSNNTLTVNNNKAVSIGGTDMRYYDFVPLVSGTVNVYTTSSIDTYGYLYKNGTQLTSNDDGGNNYNFSYSYNVTAGEKYTIGVRGYGSSTSGSATLFLSGTALPSAGGTTEEGGNSLVVTYDASYSLGTAEAKTGYNFLGWYTDIDCGGTKLTDNKGNSLSVWQGLSDTVVYSGYQKVQYPVTFDTQGGSAIDGFTLGYGDRLDLNEYKSSINGKSFTGWYLDINDTEPYEATTMPSHALTLYAKWTNYALSDLKYDTEKTSVKVTDTIGAELFNAILVDTDGEEVAITASIVDGEQTAGSTISVQLLATGKYNKKKVKTIDDIKVCGAPTLNYNTSKDYFSLTDTLDATLWGANGKDSFDRNTTVRVGVVEEDYQGGDIVSVLIESIDLAGNVTSATVQNVKVYDKPIITYTESKTAIKADDTIGNALWNVNAEDNFGEELSVTTSILSGTQSAGKTITVQMTSTDSKGNVHTITFAVKVYGKPTVNQPTKVDFKVTDEITVDGMGQTATDSFGEKVEDVTVTKKTGTQTAGKTMVYTVTATDVAGNISTQEYTVYIYDTPAFTKTATTLKASDDLTNISSFGITAKDSFGNNLTLSFEKTSGNFVGGETVTYSFGVEDKAGNVANTETTYKVYAQSDIVITYYPGLSDAIKLSSHGEEFNASAVGSFGESCTITVLGASETLSAGKRMAIKLRATDPAGNYKETIAINDIAVYGTPTATYIKHEQQYLLSSDTKTNLFRVYDSFGEELFAEVTKVSETATDYTVQIVSDADEAGNILDKTVEIIILGTDESAVDLVVGGKVIGTQRVTKGETYTFPCVAGYEYVWKINDIAVTDKQGESLSAWDKDSGGYVAEATVTIIHYSITYYLNGGTNDDDNPTTYTVEDEITLQEATKVTNKEVLSSTPIGNGMYSVETKITAYTFLGWYTEDTYQNKVETISGTGNRTLYAKWSENVTTTTSEQAYNRDGNYIYFGSYPQTKVSDSSTITALNNAISFSTKKPTNGNNNGWTSYKYYIKKSNATDFMWYIDKVYNGNKYRGVYFTSYRPYFTTYSSGADKSCQDDNGYTTSNIYWFQYEPIKWRILEESDGYATILAELILDSQEYYSEDRSGSFSHNGGTGYANNYALSNIRKWLNETFYNTAFTSLEQALIQTVTVDNSANSTTDTGNNITKATSYACSNTNDKVWLLSEYEVTKSDWGFASCSTYDTARRKTTSDYARCQGAYTYSGGTYDGKGCWWLRSPFYDISYCARFVYYDGNADNIYYVYYSFSGVVPALKICLS